VLDLPIIFVLELPIIFVLELLIVLALLLVLLIVLELVILFVLLALDNAVTVIPSLLRRTFGHSCCRLPPRATCRPSTP